VEVVYFILDDDLSTDPQIYQLLATKESASRQALNSALVRGMMKSTENGLDCRNGPSSYCAPDDPAVGLSIST
jgi:hypothetical protein